jgi:hypothetical protein
MSMATESLALVKPAQRISARRIAIVAYGAVLLALVVHFGFYLRYALNAVRYPFQLDYGEGIVWQQALLIPGQLMYGDITRFPFIVFHYPPLYHLAVRAGAALTGDALLAGRGISLTCTLLTGLFLAALAYDAIGSSAGQIARRVGAAVAGLCVFCFWPVVFWSPYLRVDMLALMLSCLGLLLAGRSFRRPWLLYPAVLCFVLAVYTKQTSITAPLAVLPVVFMANRRLTFKAFGLGLLVGLLALLALIEMTHGGFIRHLVLYNLNRFSLSLAIWSIYEETLPHALFFLMALAGLIAGWREHAARRATPEASLMAMLTLYLVLTSFTLIGLGKTGGAQNYFIEWMCVWSVLIGILAAASLQRIIGADVSLPERWYVPALLVPSALLLQVAALPSGFDFGGDNPQQMSERAAIVTMIRNAPSPVLSDDMVLLLKAGQTVPWEPSIFAELASTGRWDETPFVDMIAHHAFAFVITEANPGDLIYDTRFTPAVDAAIRQSYPRIEHLGGRVLRLPP